LKEYCEKHRITQKSLKLKGFGSTQTINNYLNGNTEPKADFLEKFIKEFRISAIWLMTGESQEFKSNERIIESLEEPKPPYNSPCDNPRCQEEIKGLQKRIAELEDDKNLLKEYVKDLQEKGGRIDPGKENEGGLEQRRSAG
jgi:transcriptional regulator with XRE-family HTH domain